MDKFEEYKLFVEDTARFTDRRQMVSNIYVAVNAVLVAGIGITVKDGDITSMLKFLLVVPILAAGFVVSLRWILLIRKYKVLVGLRMDELREMEDHEAMEGCHRMYHAEDRLYPRDRSGRTIPGQGLNFSDLETVLPQVFLCVYVFLFLVFLTVDTMPAVPF